MKGRGHLGPGVIKSKCFSGQQRGDSAEVFYYCCFLSIFHLPRSSLFLGSASGVKFVCCWVLSCNRVVLLLIFVKLPVDYTCNVINVHNLFSKEKNAVTEHTLSHLNFSVTWLKRRSQNLLLNSLSAGRADPMQELHSQGKPNRKQSLFGIYQQNRVGHCRCDLTLHWPAELTRCGDLQRSRSKRPHLSC